MNTSNPGIFTFQFFSENGEGPTPETTYTVTLNPGEAGGDPQTIEGVTSPYTLPNCPFTAPEGYIFAGWALGGTVYAVGTEVVLTNNTAFTATWKQLEARTYELVTSAAGLVDGGTYLIASELFADEIYLMSKQTTNNRAQYKVTGVEGTTLTLDESWIAMNEADDLVFEFTLETAENGWAFHDEVTGGYLYAAGNETNKKNWLRTENDLDDNGQFVIVYEGDDGATVPVAQGENTRGYMHYNDKSGIFSCYAETSTITGAVYLYKLVEETPEAPSFRGLQLELSGKIGVMFNMNLPEIVGVDYADSYMTFTIPHGECTAEAAYTEGSDSFTCYINAIQMAEPITATFHYTQNGDEKTVEITRSAKNYFESYDDNKDQFNDKTQALIEATADYGYYTQAFLAAQKGWNLDGEDAPYAKMDKRYKESFDEYDVSGYAISCPDIGELFSKVSFSLVLDSETAIRLYLTPNEGVDEVTATCLDGKDATVTKKGARWVVEIPNISAHQLSTTYTVTVNSTATISVSALSYVKLMLDNYTDQTAQNAAAAIYYYSAAADAYKGN